jgi:hypothetical protein
MRCLHDSTQHHISEESGPSLQRKEWKKKQDFKNKLLLGSIKLFQQKTSSGRRLDNNN